MNTIENAALFAELGLTRPQQTKSSSNELGQEDFLKLMTAQLQNQDPLEPTSNGEFMGQLAQFGTVTGIGDLKTEIQNLVSTLSSNQTFQAAGMVGRQVLVPATQGILEEDGVIEGAIELEASASSVTIEVQDLSGQLIRNLSLGRQSPGMVTFNWDGLATDGEAVPPGRYVIRAEAITGGVNEAQDVLIAETVRSVSIPKPGEALTLDLAGSGVVNFSEIRQIR